MDFLFFTGPGATPTTDVERGPVAGAVPEFEPVVNPVVDPVVSPPEATTPVDDGAVATDDAASLRRDVEALLFASGSPLTTDAMGAALATIHFLGPDSLEVALASLAVDFPPGGERGIELVRLAGGWAFRTNPRCRPVVAALFELPDDGTRLSPAAMEVLAIVAYLQPVSRAQMSEIRGVNSDSPLRTLTDRELITEVGRAQTGGGAVLYGTTERFQAMFGLAGLEDLPDLEGFALGEEQKEELRRKLGLLGGPE